TGKISCGVTSTGLFGSVLRSSQSSQDTMVPAMNSIANKCFFIFSDFLEFDIQTDTVRPGWRRLQIFTDTDTVTIVGELTGYNGVTGISEFRLREMRSFTVHGERVTRNNPDGKILDKIPAGYNRLRQRVT